MNVLGQLQQHPEVNEDKSSSAKKDADFLLSHCNFSRGVQLQSQHFPSPKPALSPRNKRPGACIEKCPRPTVQADRTVRILEQCYQRTQAVTIQRMLTIVRTLKVTPALVPRFVQEVTQLRIECSQDRACRVAAEFAFSFVKALSECRSHQRATSDSGLNLDFDKLSSLRGEVNSSDSPYTIVDIQEGKQELQRFLSECITVKLTLEPTHPAQRVSGQDLYEKACSLQVPPQNWRVFIQQELNSASNYAVRPQRRRRRSQLPMSIS